MRNFKHQDTSISLLSHLQEFLDVPDLLSFNRTVLHVVVDPATGSRAGGRLRRLFINDNLMRTTENNTSKGSCCCELIKV